MEFKRREKKVQQARDSKKNTGKPDFLYVSPVLKFERDMKTSISSNMFDKIPLSKYDCHKISVIITGDYSNSPSGK
jgi:hypothetical protein